MLKGQNSSETVEDEHDTKQPNPNYRNNTSAEMPPDDDFKPALLIVDLQEDFCPPVSPSNPPLVPTGPVSAQPSR